MRTHTILVLSVLALFLIVSLSGSASAGQSEMGGKQGTSKRLPAPQHLPEAVRVILSERMRRHAVNMADLQWAALLLSHKDIEDIAGVIKSEPRLGRPVGGSANGASDLLNSSLPPRFFQLQDALHKSAEALQKAAAAEDNKAVAEAYGELTKTCILCHASYLYEKPEVAAPGKALSR